MNAEVMKLMLNALPDGGAGLYRWRAAGGVQSDGGLTLSSRQNEVDVWMQAYADPAFLWRYACYLVNNRLPMPSIPLDGPMQWFLRAYQWESRRTKVDSELMSAIALAHPTKENRLRRDIVRALILSNGESLTRSCLDAGVNPVIVDAYESLFYNISMRVDDGIHALGMAYPEGRMVEWYDGYIKSATFGDLLVRAGYRNGVQDVMWLAGLRGGQALWDKTAADKDLPGKFVAMTLTNGYILSANGFAGQSGLNAPAVSAARGTINAASQGGGGAAGTLAAGNSAGNASAALAMALSGEMLGRAKQLGDYRQERRRQANLLMAGNMKSDAIKAAAAKARA